MAKKPYDFLIFIGRFQPLHLGHEHVIRQALEQAETVLVFVGSSNLARSVRNPFTFQERRQMIERTFADEVATGRIIIQKTYDHPYNDTAWIAHVQRTVRNTVLAAGNRDNPTVTLAGLNDFDVGLIGHGKDGTSYYLKLFPEWGAVDIKSPYGTFNATDIRVDYFRKAPLIARDCLSAPVAEFMEQFRLTDTFRDLVAEAEHVRAYQKAWEAAPYAPTFVTVDAVCVQSGHVLMVERGGSPGKGLLALPGGFLDPGERLRDAVVRELKEETRIRDQKGEIPPALLASYIEDSKTRVFDDPNRSARGRTVTHAFYFNLPERADLFSVKGDDDATRAQWYELGTLDPCDCFEDHCFIIQEMTGVS